MQGGLILSFAVLNYFLNTNSLPNSDRFLRSNFGRLNSVIRLGGYPSVAASGIIRVVCSRARDKGLRVELIHNPLDNTLEGVIVPERMAGVINYPLYDGSEYHLAAILNDDILGRTSACLASAQRHFAAAREIHEKWEKTYSARGNSEDVVRFAVETAGRFIDHNKSEETGKMFERFYGAVTAEGPVDYVDSLTAPFGKRYFIKGKPGRGKSAFLKQIAEIAAAAGFDAELYYNPINPDSLDLVTFRELDLCIFDSTSLYFPVKPGDEPIDFLSVVSAEKTEDKCRSELIAATSDYKSEIAKATKQLGRAKRYYDEVQNGYAVKINAELLETVEEKINQLFFG